MAPRIVPPPKKNRAPVGLKYSLKIIKGDLADSFVDESTAVDEQTLAVADVDITECYVRREHHLQAALTTKALYIPTPGAIRVVDNYEQLYPPARWKDPITYLQTTQTVEEACTNALVDHEYTTYYMDEIDKQWLDKNNQEARGEGTSAQGATSAARSARKGKDKEPEMGVPVSITEDEFELVMGLLEKVTDQKVLEGDGPDFSLYRSFFSEPLPANLFASYTTPSWIPAPALFVRIARTIYPHWKHRRSLLKGRRIRPSLNYDESDFLNESYVCFRRRDNKPVRKTRAGQVMNNADKLAQIHENLSQALNLANALLKRETIKQAAAVESQNVWNARRPLADLLRAFPALATKADEAALLAEKPRKVKPPRPSLPKVIKVLPPSNPASTAPSPQKAILPSERCAAIQEEMLISMNYDSQRNQHQVDVIDDPYQPHLIPRAEKLWVEVPPFSAASSAPADEMSMRSGSRALRMRYGRGGRRFVDRRSSHPFMPSLHNHRQRVSADLDDETMRRLEAQWRFDADDGAAFGPAEERNRELVDEYDNKYLIARMDWASTEEAELVTDATLMVQGSEGHERKLLPFITNAIHVAWVRNTPLAEHLAETVSIGSNRAFAGHTPRASAASTPVQQKTPQANSASPQSRVQAPAAVMRPPPPLGPPKMQENISPKKPSPTPGAHTHTHTYSASPSPHAPARVPIPRAPAHVPTTAVQPQNPNPIVPAPDANAVKVVAQPNHSHTATLSQNQNQNQNHHHVQTHPHPLQTNGTRTAAPAYVPLNAGTNMSLKLPPARAPRPSPLAYSVGTGQTGSLSPRPPSRTNGS
ncbi:hypothetical protein C8R44DRAFT_877987 [Mycena epipterygia]|nr:hypothetical protein C8R44DRAFT_877987 [Mycena epipterygia]